VYDCICLLCACSSTSIALIVFISVIVAFVSMAAAGGPSARAASISSELQLGDPELKRSVMKRLDTFIPLGSERIGNVSVSDAADDGYAYDRIANAIRCVWCLATIVDLRNLDASVIRQLHNDRCPRGPPPDDDISEDQLEGPGAYTEVDLSSQGVRGDGDGGGSTPGMQRVRDDNVRMREERTCKRCGRSQVETLFLPCRHLVACEACADEVQDCFMCNAKILGTVRIYLN